MQLNRIVKSAYARARKAGYIGSLKQFARSGDCPLAVSWLARKSEQRRSSATRRAVLNHNIVYTAAAARQGSC